jgi:hypothetical protein
LKNLDKSKVNRKIFIKKELTENPEFFKAFPHMQGVLNADKGNVTSVSGSSQEGETRIEEESKYYENEVLGFKDPSGKSESPYFDSLLHHHN